MLGFARRVPVFHIASMARSGETVFLRALASHPRVKIVHNLQSSDGEHAVNLFEFLQRYRGRSLRMSHPLVKPYGVQKGDVLVVKQGVWEHGTPFDGVILSRNPVSIFASLVNYDAPRDLSKGLAEQWGRNGDRLVRWMRSIDPTVLPEFKRLPPLPQFCAFYNRRMGKLLETGLPVAHYERFVTEPAEVLRFTMSCLGLAYADDMLNAHAGYESGEVGHGRIDLGAPLNTASLNRYQTSITREEFDEVVSRTDTVSRGYGYDMQWEEIGVGSDR